jgi:hypothetical protein
MFLQRRLVRVATIQKLLARNIDEPATKMFPADKNPIDHRLSFWESMESPLLLQHFRPA